MSGIELRLLGGASLHVAGTPLQGRATHRHRLALLARLALAVPAGVSRDKLVALLWPERDPSAARQLLRSALHDLRAELGPNTLATTGSDVRLDARMFTVDVSLFDERLAAGNLEEAVALYRGPFLDGFFLDGSEAFEEWASNERARLAREYERALERLAAGAESRGDLATAARWWQALATVRPSDGRIALRLIESNISLGNPAGALTHAVAHTSWLREEHGATPDAELTARVAALRRRLSQRPVAGSRRAGQGSVADDAPVEGPPVMSGFELRLFGGVAIREGEQSLTGRVVHRHRLALLARLASAAPDSVSRDKLVGLLWPERDEASARHLLRAALHDIRAALGADVVPMGGSDLRLDTRRIFVDVQLFAARLAAGDLEGAVELYDGPFLDGFSLDGAEEFNGWATAERGRLAAMYEAALEQLATSAESREAPQRAAEYWSALVAVRPTDGRVALRLLDSLVASGDSAAALAHAASHARRLRDELGADVAPGFASRVAALGKVVQKDAVPTAISRPHVAPSRRRLAWTLSSVGLVALAGTLLVGLTWGRPHDSTAATVIAVAPFDEVGTVPHAVRDGLATLISANLDQVGDLRLVPAAQVAARAHDGSETSPAGLLQSLHAELLITGVVVPAPEGIAVTTRIVDRSGAVRAMGEVRGSVADLATLVDHISLTLLRDLWGRRWRVPTPRLAAVVTPSAPALRAYLRGEMFLRAALWDSAAAEFASAIDQDSAFALAHLRIAEPYGWRYGMSSAPAQRALASAARFADRLPPRERLLLTVRRLHEGGSMAALDSSSAFAERYPDDAEAQYVRADVRFHAMEAAGRNMIVRAAFAFDTAMTLDSNSARVFAHPLSLALMTGDSARFDRAAGRLGSLAAGSHMQIAQGWDYALLRRVRFGAQEDAARALLARLRSATPPPFWQLTDLLPALERAVYSADVPNPGLVLAVHETMHSAYRAEPARVADADGLRSAVLIGLGRMDAARAWTARTWDAYPSGTPGMLLTPVVLGYAPVSWLDGISERIAATPYWQSTPSIRRKAEYWRGMIALTNGEVAVSKAALLRAGAPPAAGAADDSVGPALASALRAAQGWLRVVEGDSARGMREVEAGLQLGGYDGEALVLNRPTRLWWTKTLARLPERRVEGVDRIRGELVRAEGYHIAWWRLELARALDALGEKDAASIERRRFDALWSQADASAKAVVPGR